MPIRTAPGSDLHGGSAHSPKVPAAASEHVPVGGFCRCCDVLHPCSGAMPAGRAQIGGLGEADASNPLPGPPTTTRTGPAPVTASVPDAVPGTTSQSQASRADTRWGFV